MFIVIMMLPYIRCHASGNYQSLAKEIALAALNARISKIAVFPFDSMDNTDAFDGRNIAEQLTTEIVRTEKVEVVERGLLEKVMEEQNIQTAGFAHEAASKKPGKIFPADAIVTGFVSNKDGDIRVYARLIDVTSGKVLFAAAKRFFKHPAKEDSALDEKESSAEKETASAAYGNRKTGYKPKTDMRDSLSQSSEYTRCQDTIDALTSLTVNLKAKYWASKIKESNFAYLRRITEPDSDIQNPALRSWFNALLDSWHYLGITPTMFPSELDTLRTTDERIADIKKTCHKKPGNELADGLQAKAF